MIDRAASHAEILTLIAQCGRASPTWASGKLGAVWDEAGKPATALITPGNIVQGSFEVDYASGKAAEEIACRYIDSDLDWQWNTVRRTVPGITRPGSTATLTLMGVTGRVQATMECNLQAARQVYHRRRLRWEMGAEGMAVRRGDVVHVTHSLIDGGATGRLAGGTAERLQLDRPVTLSGAGDYLLLRLPDGSLHTSAAAHPDGGDGETDNIVLASPLPEAPDAGGASPLDTLWRLYAADTPPARARIVAIEPAAGGRVPIEAIDEADAYHVAATADLSVPLPGYLPARARIFHIAVSETLLRAGNGYAVEIAVSLTVAGDWRGGVIRAAPDGGTPRTVARLVDGETEASWITAPAGTLIITAIPGTAAAPLGAPFTVTYEIQGKVLPPGPPANFLIDVLGDGTRRFRWTPPADADLAGVLIRHAETAPGLSWETMLPMHNGPLVASPWETNSPPAGSWSFAARAIDTSGNISKAVWITGDLPDPPPRRHTRLGVPLRRGLARRHIQRGALERRPQRARGRRGLYLGRAHDLGRLDLLGARRWHAGRARDDLYRRALRPRRGAHVRAFLGCRRIGRGRAAIPRRGRPGSGGRRGLDRL